MSNSHLITIQDIWRHLITYFNSSEIIFGHGYPNASEESRALISFALLLPIIDIDNFLLAKLSEQEIKNIINLAKKRVEKKIPLAYITGEMWLCGYHFYVETGTIVPRSLIANPLSQRLSPFIPDDYHCENILELCCGGGSLLVIAANAFSEADVVGVDIDEKAIALAQKNISQYHLENRVKILSGDLYSPLSKNLAENIKFDLIISNPPYVKSADMKNLPAEYCAEPSLALDGGEDGLFLVEKIIAQAKKYLTDDGYLILEIGGNVEEFINAYQHIPFVFIDNDSQDESVVLISAEDLP